MRYPRLATLAGLLVVLALASVVYSSSFGNAFLNWDDPVNVTQNQAIRAFSSGNARVWFSEPLLGMYSPLVYLSYAVDYRIAGLNPAVYHTTNLVLHLACVLLVFVIVRRLTDQPIAALAIAALFAVHPANVAAVTPISVRSSLLYAFFYLAAFTAYLSHLARPASWRLAVTFVLFVASSLSKSAAAVFPVLLLLTDYYRGREFGRAVWLEKIPFFAVSVATGITTLAFRSDSAPVGTLEPSLLERIGLAAYQLGLYGARAVAPANLSPFYPYPDLNSDAFHVRVVAAPVLLLVVGVLAACVRPWRKPLAFGLLFFVLHLALVLKVVPLGEEFTADRYLYVPLVGLGVMAAAIATRWSRLFQRGALAGVVVLVAVWSVASYTRSYDWRDDMTFNSRILELHPRTAIAYSNRAAAKLQAGDVSGAWWDSTEAIRHDASNARAYFNRATASMLAGRPAEALWDASQAISYDPTLGASFELRAQARLRTGDAKGARDDADRAIALTPHGDEVFKSYVTRGLAFAMLDDGPGAVADLDRAIELNPREPALLLNRGQIRIQFGDVRGGCADLRQAASRGRDDARTLIAQFCAGG